MFTPWTTSRALHWPGNVSFWWLFGIFAGLAFGAGIHRIYGVLTYLTNQRVPEIGLRMALGAGTRNVIRLVLGQSFGMIVVVLASVFWAL